TSTTLGSTVPATRTKAACRLSAAPAAPGPVPVVFVVATGAAAGFLAELHALNPGHRRAATTAMDVERCIAPTVSVGAGPHIPRPRRDGAGDPRRTTRSGDVGPARTGHAGGNAG